MRGMNEQTVLSLIALQALEIQELKGAIVEYEEALKKLNEEKEKTSSDTENIESVKDELSKVKKENENLQGVIDMLQKEIDERNMIEESNKG